MIRKRTLIGIMLVVALLGVTTAFSLAAPVPSRPAQEGQNLLQNPGFEGITCAPGSAAGWCDDNWTRDTFNGTIYTEIYSPQGWVTWWREGDGYGRPEVLVIPKMPPFTGELTRIRSGNYALKLFTFFRNQDAGYYQIVTGLEPGAAVQFSVYAHGWSCDNNDRLGYTCGDPWNQIFQVGIEPNGVADPFSPGIVWSSEQTAPDHFALIGPVTAQVGEGGTVVVFMRSKTKWPFEHLDAYWDDASLVMTAPGTPPTATPLPPPPTATPGPSPTPLPPPTPRPDGAVVHIVESGDTLLGIALMYGVDPDQIRQLNATSLGPNDMLWPGQELMISMPSETSTPTPLPEPPTLAPTPAPDNSVAEVTSEGASVCVLAYHDRNGDEFRDEEAEELLPNAEFTIADVSGVIDQYVSDGISEPHCFTGLPSGAYRVIQDSPPGYESSGLAERAVAVAEGTSLDLQFGNVRSENPSPGEAPTPTSGSGGDNGSGNGSTVGRIFATVAKVSGIMVLILAAGVAVLFVLNRRRM